ncbi:NAD-binding protein [Sphingomonas aerolata]|uniref:NAD-binding protein n=1 Tax=Sphingomonas aerolata TaxID=185951 RepID=UPI0011B25FF3
MRRPHRHSFTPTRRGKTPFGSGCYGGWGAEAVDELVKRGADPETIVVIDDRTVALYATEAWGTTVMQGDATRNAALEAVQLACARALFVAAGWDGTSDPDRPEPRKFRRRPVGRAGPTARISRRINGSRRCRRTGRPARTSTDRDRTATEVGIALSEIRAGLGHRIYRAIEALESASRRHSGSNRGISSSRPYGVVRPNPPPTDTVCYE